LRSLLTVRTSMPDRFLAGFRTKRDTLAFLVGDLAWS